MGDEGSAPPSGAGRSNRRNRNRTAGSSKALPPETPKVQDTGDEGSAPPSGAGRSNRRNKSSGTAGSSRALPPETPKVQDTLVATGATCPSNVGPMPSTRKTRNKIPVVTSLSTRVQKMSAPEFTGLKDPYDKIMGSRDKCNLGTGLVLHMIMGNPVCLWDANYPENPGRFYSVLLRSNALGLLDRCALIEARKATKEEILRLHSESHFNQLEAFDACNENVILESFCAKFDAVYIHPSTFQAACLAAGSTIQLVDEICTKKITNGIAIVRPPGHHAMENEYNGYCFFNNVALAAKHALEKHHLQRVLIVDWDVHHGQGTQQMFYGDKRVLYFSIHRYENGSFWPYLSESNLDRIGDGAGKGFNINVPLNTTGLGNSEYMAIFHKLLLPVAYEFRPEVVLVSAGFDSALGDEKGEMEVTPNCYAHLLWSLKGLAQGNVAVVLEGGYCLKSLQEGVAMTLRSLLGDPCPMMEPLGEPHQVVKDTILRSIVHLMPYWKCLYNDYKMGIESSAKVLSSPIWPSPPLLMLQVNQPPYATRNCYPVPSEEQFKFYDNKIELLINATNFTTAAVRVCYAYEVEMANYVDDSPGLQVEHPDRILVTNKLLVEFGLVARCKRVKGTPAQPSDILLAHDQDYHSFLKNTSEMSVKDLEGLQKTFNSVILKNTSYASMMIAVGCLINVVDDVCSGLSQSGVAVIRPPGHHAEPNHPSGFCLVNNVAIAAKHAQKKFGLKRVLILDWDVHHGNGTQRIFYEDPSVLYISIHRYDGGRFFPSGPDGNSDKVGVGLGEGFNVNIPWSSGGMHDGDYLAAFTNIIMPIAYEYNPELVIISAGFDAAVNDPLGRCLVTPEAYGHFTHWLMSLANGRVIVALEGGYNVHSVSTCMASCMKALLNDPLTMLEHVKASYGALRSIYETSNIHCKYWACLRVKNAGANARQIINGTHLFALKQFGKEYDQLNPNEQIDCFRSLINPFHVLDSDATTVISQFLNLSLNNKVKEDSLP